MSFFRKNRTKFFIGVACSSILVASAPLGNAQTQNSGVPLTLQEAVEQLGMDSGSKHFKYKSANITEKKAIFEGVTFVENNATIKSKTVTFFRRPVDGKFALILSDVTSGDENIDVNIAETTLIIDEIMEGGKRKLIVKKPDGKEGFQGDLKITDATINFKEDKQKFSIKSIDIDNFTSVEKMRFDDLRVGGIGFVASGMKFNIAKFEVGGLSDYVFEKINETADEKINGSDDSRNNMGVVGGGLEFFQKAAIGKLLIEGVNVAQIPVKSKKSTKTKDGFDFFKIGKVEIRNFDYNKLDRFAVENLDFRAVSDKKPIIVRLGEFSFDDMRFDIYKSFASAYLTAENEDSAKRIRDTKLSQIMKKGPLDMTLRAFNFRNFNLSADGAVLTLDQLTFVSSKEVNGLYTDWEMPDGNLEFKLQKTSGPLAKTAANGFKELGLDDFKMSFGSHATYDPVKDELNTDKSYIKIDKFFEFNAKSNVANSWAWLQRLTVGELLDVVLSGMGSKDAPLTEEEMAEYQKLAQEAAKSVGAENSEAIGSKRERTRGFQKLQPQGPTEEEKKAAEKLAEAYAEKSGNTSVPNLSKEALKSNFDDWLKIYKGLKIKSLDFVFNDLGMMDKITADAGVANGKGSRKLREEWAKDWDLKTEEEKDTPQFLRDTFKAISNFIRNGGSIRVRLENDKGVEFGDFMSLEADHKALGFNITN